MLAQNPAQRDVIPVLAAQKPCTVDWSASEVSHDNFLTLERTITSFGDTNRPAFLSLRIL